MRDGAHLEASERDHRAVLGAHILHHAASELIAEAVSVIEFSGSDENIGRTTHSHPTLSEAVREAALNVEKRALHIMNR